MRLAAAAAEARQQQHQQRTSVTAEHLGMNGDYNTGQATTSPSPTTTIALPAEPVAPPVAVHFDTSSGTSILEFPRRPGYPPCDFYVKTGHCRFGESCRFDHPPEYAVRLSHQGLPLRPGQAMCQYYERHGDCKFGPACRFDHPVGHMINNNNNGTNI